MSKKKKKEISIKSAEQKALFFLADHSENAYSLKQISRKMNFLNKASRRILFDALEGLAERGEIEIHKDGYYQYLNEYSNPVKENETPNRWTNDEHIGRIDFVNPSFAYVVSDDFELDVRIKASKLAGALDGDTVAFVVTDKNRKTGRTEGEVIDIVKRKKVEFVGTFENSKGFAFVIPAQKECLVTFTSLKTKKGQQ